jgi:putative transcriptional regulator
MKRRLFDDLVTSVREAGSLYRAMKRNGRVASVTLDVPAIRGKTGLSQSDFALLLGVSIKTLQNWEQGRREPQGPARALLTVFKNDPRGAVRALHRSEREVARKAT